MLVVDVAVIGGGPAGTATALTLARAGRDVVIVDKAVFPRDKCCGDGLTTGALRQLEALGLDPVAVPSWTPVTACHVRSPSGRTVTFPFPAGRGLYGAVARRHELDAALVDLARAAGAKILDGHALTGVIVAEDGVVLSVEGGEPVAARYVVGADGMWSTLRRLLDVTEAGQPYLGEWHGFRQYFTDASPSARDLWVWFEPDLLPGYAWSFPLPGGGANVGFGIRRKPGESTGAMAGRWRTLLHRPHIRDVLGTRVQPETPHKAWPIPARLGRAALSAGGGRILFVGDAARATDPLTGEGIGQALETGRLAADCVLAVGPARPDEAARRYQRALRRGMVTDHALAQHLSGVLTSPRRARAAIRVAGATAWTRRNFARWLFEDYPRALVATPSRWNAGVLAGRGAYS